MAHMRGRVAAVRWEGRKGLTVARTLTDEDVAAIADAVAARITKPATTEDILTRTEAMAYTKRSSDRAFARWCKKWSVRAANHGRYSRAMLDVALKREARAR